MDSTKRIEADVNRKYLLVFVVDGVVCSMMPMSCSHVCSPLLATRKNETFQFNSLTYFIYITRLLALTFCRCLS